ncbi:13690_t:CDS:1, partial [Racocetra persica]
LTSEQKQISTLFTILTPDFTMVIVPITCGLSLNEDIYYIASNGT